MATKLSNASEDIGKGAVQARNRAFPVSPRAWNSFTTTVLCALVALAGWQHRAIADDGAIFLRTVRQVLAGNGVVVNQGERVEANTSTLWQWILVLLGAVFPGDLGFIAVMAGLVLTVAGFWLAMDASRRIHASSGQVYLLPLGVLVPLAVIPFWDFFTAALDSGLMFFWLGACWWLLIRMRDYPGRVEMAFHGVWYGLGVLVRPDLFLVGAIFLLFSLWASRISWRETLVRSAAAALIPLAYEVFRAGYYGILVPLPALTKEAGATEWERGFRYVWDFTEPYFLYVPAVLLAAAALPRLRASIRGGDRRRLAPLLPAVSAGVLLVYVLKLGGDYMHGRMMLPIVFLLILPVLFVPLRRSGAVLFIAMATWAIACVGPWNPDAYRGHDAETTARVRNNDIVLTGSKNADHMRDWVAAFPGLEASVRAGLAEGRPVFVQIGGNGEPVAMHPLNPALEGRISIPGGYLGVTGEIVPLDQRIAELWGLANTIGAHLEYMPNWRDQWPGHRKLVDEVWLLALELDPSVTTVPATYPHVSPEALAAARRVLGCGKVKELLDSVREPLTFKRFLSNLTGSVARTSLRIPRDPFAAEQKFCA